MRFLLLASTVSLLSIAPASAQIWGGPVPASAGGSFAGRGIRIAPQPRSARSEIRAGEAGGAITRQEARQLRRANDANSALADRLSRHGLSDAAAAELETRAILLHEDIVRARSHGGSRTRK